MPLLTSGAIKGRRCPICNADHASCGLPYQGTPTDIPEVSTVAESHDLAIYQDAQGHTFQMTAEDAAASGYTKVSAPRPEAAVVTATEPPAEDPTSHEVEPPAEDPEAEEKARAAAANKARTSSGNK